jgi:hypothetical protein
MIPATSVLAALADESDGITVSLRIEGIMEYIYYNTMIELNVGATVEDLMKKTDSMDDAPKIVIGETENGAYVSEIDGLAEFDCEGLSGWMFTRNNIEAVAGISETMLENDDSIVFFYADPYGGPGFQYPIVDISMLYSSGIIKFTSKDTTYDAEQNATTSLNPIVMATVTFDDKTYTTNSAGEIVIEDKNGIAGFHELQIEKHDNKTGVPTVLRFAPDYTVYVPFSDTLAGAWYEAAIGYCISAGYFIGVDTAANLFAPLNRMSMAQLCTVLARISGVDVDTPADPWYSAALEWAAENDVITIEGFNAGANVTREVFIYMFYITAARLEGYDMTVRAEIKDAADYGDISEEYREAIAWAVASGVIRGTSNDSLTISPGVEVNRATVCQMLYNYYN